MTLFAPSGHGLRQADTWTLSPVSVFLQGGAGFAARETSLPVRLTVLIPVVGYLVIFNSYNR